MITATGWTFAQLNQTSACDVFDLLRYWRESPPVHDLLALRYLGAPEKRAAAAAPARSASEADRAAQMPMLAGVPGMKVRKMSPRTKELYEYAQSVMRIKQ